MPRFHRDSLDVPFRLHERKEMIEWLLSHPLWSHDYTLLEPTDGSPLWDEKEVDGQKGWTEWTPRTPDDSWREVTHPRFVESYRSCIEFEFVYVDPKSGEVEEDDSRNTKFQVWIEAGGWMDQSKEANTLPPPEGWNNHNRWVHVHDYRLDCGGDTIEDALLELAVRVKFYYNDDGSDRLDVPERCEGFFENEDFPTSENWKSNCDPDGNGFCSKCGFYVRDC